MSARRTGAGISCASGYNSEILKSMDCILQKRPKGEKKRGDELTNELQIIWNGSCMLQEKEGSRARAAPRGMQDDADGVFCACSLINLSECLFKVFLAKREKPCDFSACAKIPSSLSISFVKRGLRYSSYFIKEIIT